MTPYLKKVAKIANETFAEKNIEETSCRYHNLVCARAVSLDLVCENLELLVAPHVESHDLKNFIYRPS